MRSEKKILKRGECFVFCAGSENNIKEKMGEWSIEKKSVRLRKKKRERERRNVRGKK